MTLVTIDLQNAGYETGPDDRVVFYSPANRNEQGVIISTAETSVPLVDGQASKELAPGPVVVQILAQGVTDTRPKSGYVPEDGPVSLWDVIVDWTPALVDQGILAILAALDEALSDVTAAESAAITAISDEVTRIAGDVDIRIPAGKNLFNPDDVVVGEAYDPLGSLVWNAKYRMTPHYPVSPGQSVALSGLAPVLESTGWKNMFFWDSAGELVSIAAMPDYPYVETDWMVEVAPEGAASFSVNLATRDPEPDLSRLQIEYAPAPTEYEPYYGLRYGLPADAFEGRHYKRSEKNLYDGNIVHRRRINDAGLYLTSSDNDAATSFIPVEYGKTYTVSGLDPDLVAGNPGLRRVCGYSTDRYLTSGHVKPLPVWAGTEYTFTVDDPDVRFVVLSLARNDWGGDAARAAALQIQVEEGPVATTYEPPRYVVGTDLIWERLGRVGDNPRRAVSAFEEMSETAIARASAGVVKDFGPWGISYRLDGQEGVDSGTTLFAHAQGLPAGKREVTVALYSLDSLGAPMTPTLDLTTFSVPSGQLIHQGPTSDYGQTGEMDEYTHPTVDYDPVGVAGYKYWLVASVFPGYATEGVTWEDEDVFVSNDAKEWLRIRSPYEADRADTAPGLVLPEHNLETSTGRRYAFLPCPPQGTTIEVSTPDRERETVTIGTSRASWKHDPAILIDDGYVYIYHTFNMYFDGSEGTVNRFLVLTRTSNGVDWECVRPDGSTLPLDSPEAASKMFTKDAQGRTNYIRYGTISRGNPEVIRWGVGDYEMFYGGNFSEKFTGATPWDFDFTAPTSIGTPSSQNHPGLLAVGGELLLLNDQGLHLSTDRGLTFTKLPHTPTWIGGVTGKTYKKAMCLGEGGKVVVFDVAIPPSASATRPGVGQSRGLQRRDKMLIQIFPDVATLKSLAETGLDEGYVDVQIEQVNYTAGARRSHFLPYVGPSSPVSVGNNRHQEVKLRDVVVSEGDEFYIYVTMISRTGGSVSINGMFIK